MNDLELEFVLEKERRYLKENPEKAGTLVINYLEDFLNAARKVKELEQKIESLMADNQALTLQLISEPSDRKAVLPRFLESQRY